MIVTGGGWVGGIAQGPESELYSLSEYGLLDHDPFESGWRGEVELFKDGIQDGAFVH